MPPALPLLFAVSASEKGPLDLVRGRGPALRQLPGKGGQRRGIRDEGVSDEHHPTVHLVDAPAHHTHMVARPNLSGDGTGEFLWKGALDLVTHQDGDDRVRIARAHCSPLGGLQTVRRPPIEDQRGGRPGQRLPPGQAIAHHLGNEGIAGPGLAERVGGRGR